MPKDLIQKLAPTQKQMQFEPVEDDDDEISEFIRNDPQAHDNVWDLHENLDSDQLSKFWTDAVNELGPLQSEMDNEE